MSMGIHPASWHGFEAWAIESPVLRAITVPELGAKLVSLVGVAAEQEWIVGPGDKRLQPNTYGSSFVEADMSGWDEMFPTIISCPYPVPGPHYGLPLPDHGEVWSLPWQVEQAGKGQLTLSVQGRALPYRLMRTLDLQGDDTLRLGYQVTNSGDQPLVYLWAAHPQFAVNRETEIVLPPDVTEVVNVIEGQRWGPPGRRHAWPMAEDTAGTVWCLARLGPASRRDCRKFYVRPEIRVGWAELAQRDSGNRLRLSWSPDEIPYLGIWIDEGAYSHTSVVALEPSTGYYDSLTIAWNGGRASMLAPGASAEWRLGVRLWRQ